MPRDGDCDRMDQAIAGVSLGSKDQLEEEQWDSSSQNIQRGGSQKDHYDWARFFIISSLSYSGVLQPWAAST